MREAAAENFSVGQLLADPAASAWLKSALCSALERDIVDALNDALVLADVLDARLRSTLGIDEEVAVPNAATDSALHASD
jgi:hypothetical protein